jgi:hypothetical protein
MEHIVAVLSCHEVIPAPRCIGQRDGVAIETIIPEPPLQRVVAAARRAPEPRRIALDHVVARFSIQEVVAGNAAEQREPAVAEQRVRRCGAAEPVV